MESRQLSVLKLIYWQGRMHVLTVSCLCLVDTCIQGVTEDNTLYIYYSGSIKECNETLSFLIK